MKHPTWLKLPLSCLLVALAMIGLIVPVRAVINSGTVYNISSVGAGSPDIEVSSDGVFIAVAYYKQADGEGPVYVKSATSGNGWVTSRLVGFGSDPQLAFKSGVNNVVYVVWRKSGGRAIQSAKCTLNATGAPQCTLGADVQTTSSDQLNFPDVVVTNGGVVHVVWQNSTGPGVTQIEAARSSAANSVAGWTSPVIVPGGSGGVNRKPVLALGNNLHLAFLNGSSTTILTSVQHRRSADGTTWSNPGLPSIQFTIDNVNVNNISAQHDTLDNPTIAVSGNNVYLAWNAHIIGGNDFTLMHANSSDNGDNWSGPFYMDTVTPASSAPGGNARASLTQSQPPQQVGLRPSLTMNGATPAVIWQQQQPPIDCQNFGIGTLYIYRGSPLTGGGSDFLANSNDNDSMIDSDLAINGSNNHHVYMLHARSASAALPGCPPGDAGTGSYLITYRGPFDKHTLDLGEGGNNVFLPIVQK
jgi:hypothetical protein